VPTLARQVSEEFGIDLESHSSQVFGSEMISEAGAILLMDLKNYEELRHRYPEARDKLLFLRPFAIGRAPQLEITDPWNQRLAELRECYRRLIESVHGMIDSLASGLRAEAQTQQSPARNAQLYLDSPLPERSPEPSQRSTGCGATPGRAVKPSPAQVLINP
jgi:hypothetical protein